MKRVIFILTFALFAGVICANAQEVKREGNNFTQVSNIKQANDTQTEYTYTIKDIVYPIWVTKNGRCYIVRTSKNGNEYKQYLEENISRQICKELGIEYVEKSH